MTNKQLIHLLRSGFTIKVVEPPFTHTVSCSNIACSTCEFKGPVATCKSPEWAMHNISDKQIAAVQDTNPELFI